ncbi:MAG: hypothetical protein QUS07_07235 [Methanothrix sp.]|nr:hypothetical protein [Methanothrix sp.]
MPYLSNLSNNEDTYVETTENEKEEKNYDQEKDEPVEDLVYNR